MKMWVSWSTGALLYLTAVATHLLAASLTYKNVSNLLKTKKNELWFYECNFIIQRPPTCFRYSCGHLDGGKCKTVNIFIVYRDHSGVKLIQFWLIFRLNGRTAMGTKYYKLKIAVWSVVLWNELHSRLYGGLWSRLISVGVVCTVHYLDLESSLWTMSDVSGQVI